MRCTHMFTVLALAAFVLATPSNANLLENPGFETGVETPEPWEMWGSGNFQWLSSGAHTGSWCMNLGNSGLALMYQRVPATPGISYSVSAWAKRSSGNSSGTIKIEFHNVSLNKITETPYYFTPQSDWTLYTVTGVAPENTAYVTASIVGNSGGYIRFDDISLTESNSQAVNPFPSDGAHSVNVNAMLTWDAATGISNPLFDVYLGTDSTSLSLVSPSQSATNYNPQGMVQDTDYFWRVDTREGSTVHMGETWMYSTRVAQPVEVAASSSTAGLYEPLVLQIYSSAVFTDPYNLSDIRVDAVFETPDGGEITLPCYYEYGSAGFSRWTGRFAPRQIGEYSYRVDVYVGGTLFATSPAETLTSIPSDRDGFLHIDPSSFYTFVHDSGKRFRGVGENIGWTPEPSPGETDPTYEELLPKLRDSGCNFVRLWMCPWNMPLEWESYGLGSYDPAAAERFDGLLDLAEENDIYFMLALDYHGVLITEPDYWGGNNYWPVNPYNVANGGPCSSPADFFVNSAGKEIYKRRLRYMVARWGYHPHLAVFELFNEVEHVKDDENVPPGDIAAWHHEMAGYLKSIDPFEHMVSTSSAELSWLWTSQHLDFSQSHPYGSTDNIADMFTYYENTYDKPHVAGEFGYSWQLPGDPDDYARELHMGLFRGMFCPTPILPLTWWWDYHDAWDDYDNFAAAATFSQDMVPQGDQPLNVIAVYTGVMIEAKSVDADNHRYAWLHNTKSYTLNNLSVTLPALAQGDYDVRFYNTWSGIYDFPIRHEVTGVSLDLTIDSLASDSDIAISVRPVTRGNGDFDADGDVDLDDYAWFADCMAGPDEIPTPALAESTTQRCLDVFDGDADDDVDLKDYSMFELQ